MSDENEIDYSTRIVKGKYPNIKRIMFYYLFDTEDRVIYYYPELDEYTSISTVTDCINRKFNPKNIGLIDDFLNWFHENQKDLPVRQVTFWGDVLGGRINWSEEFWKWLKNKGMHNKDIFQFS